jgi:hypothetical protein
LVCIDFASAQIYHALKIMPLSHPDTEATIVPLVSFPGLPACPEARSVAWGRRGGRNVARRRSKGEKLLNPSDLEARQCHTVFATIARELFCRPPPSGTLKIVFQLELLSARASP